MKAVMKNGIEVEGTVEEIKELLSLDVEPKVKRVEPKVKREYIKTAVKRTAVRRKKKLGCRKWTDEEDEVLQKYANLDKLPHKTACSIGRKLKRSPAAISVRICNLRKQNGN